jgi:hypothetical protein
VTSRGPFPAAASTLLAPLVDGPPRVLVEAARTRVSVHYETGDPALPVLCVLGPGAVRLPHGVLTATLPGHGLVRLEGGMLVSAASTWRVSRWWPPPRPTGSAPPPDPARTAAAQRHIAAARAPGDPALRPTYDGLRPRLLLGRGPGLTPSGDDVLAAALVTAHATADPRLPGWRAATRSALAARPTTPVSHGILAAALDGWATPELAGFVDAVRGLGDLPAATDRLLAVGHSSGAALAHGVLHTLTTRELRGAA